MVIGLGKKDGRKNSTSFTQAYELVFVPVLKAFAELKCGVMKALRTTMNGKFYATLQTE